MRDDLLRQLETLAPGPSSEPAPAFLARVTRRRWARRSRAAAVVLLIGTAAVFVVRAPRVANPNTGPQPVPEIVERTSPPAPVVDQVPGPSPERPRIKVPPSLAHLRGVDDVEVRAVSGEPAARILPSVGPGVVPAVRSIPALRAFEVGRVDEL